nr:autophagy-related protein 9-like isoform X2 [Ziziphus jujuba var. spinosa]
MRLMRKENYLIGMLNKGVLAFPISKWVPGAGPTVKYGSKGKCHRLILTKTLEWTLNWCILQSMFDRQTLKLTEVTASDKLESFRAVKKVLKGHIALGNAQFPNGTNGNALDILA